MNGAVTFRYVVCCDEVGPLFRCSSAEDALRQRDRLRSDPECSVWAENDRGRVLEWPIGEGAAKPGHGQDLHGRRRRAVKAPI